MIRALTLIHVVLLDNIDVFPVLCQEVVVEKNLYFNVRTKIIAATGGKV